MANLQECPHCRTIVRVESKTKKDNLLDHHRDPVLSIASPEPSPPKYQVAALTMQEGDRMGPGPEMNSLRTVVHFTGILAYIYESCRSKFMEGLF